MFDSGSNPSAQPVLEWIRGEGAGREISMLSDYVWVSEPFPFSALCIRPITPVTKPNGQLLRPDVEPIIHKAREERTGCVR